MKGIVKWFNAKKGYGFITGEDGKELFVHYTSINVENDEFRKLINDEKVTYDLGSNDKGVCAVNVTREEVAS